MLCVIDVLFHAIMGDRSRRHRRHKSARYFVDDDHRHFELQPPSEVRLYFLRVEQKRLPCFHYKWTLPYWGWFIFTYYFFAILYRRATDDAACWHFFITRRVDDIIDFFMKSFENKFCASYQSCDVLLLVFIGNTAFFIKCPFGD